MRTRLMKAVPVSGKQGDAVVALAAWIQKYHPNVYHRIIEQGRGDLLEPSTAMQGMALSGVYGDSVSPSMITSALRTNLKRNSLLGGLGQTSDSTTPATDWGATLSTMATGILTALNQQKLFNTQISRAEQGLPPLNVDAVGVPVSFGVSPAMQQLLTYGLIGTGLYFVAKLVFGRK